MENLIKRGRDAPALPSLLWDAPVFKDGRLVGVKRRGSRVLVIDDNRDMADLCSDILRHWGFHVTTAYDGAAGLKAAGALSPDLILLNDLTPRLTGLQVLQLLRRSPKTRNIKIIFDSVDPIGELAVRMGADDFIHLPFTPDVLLGKVARAVRT